MAVKSLLVIGMVLLMESLCIAGQVPTFQYQNEINQGNSTRVINFDDGCEVDVVDPNAQEHRYSMNCHDGHPVYFGVQPGLYPYRYTEGRGTVSPVEMDLINW